MKNKAWISLAFLLFASGSLLTSCCKSGEIPAVITMEISSITDTTAQSGGIVISEGSSEVYDRGVQWSNDTSFYNELTWFTSDSSGTGSFSSTLTGLYPYMKYYVRAYATNTEGSGYGKRLSFRPPATISDIIFNPVINYGTLTDMSGNTYKIVTIGSQTWMAENLRTTLLNDGSAIQLVEKGDEWPALISPAYCWYDNDESYFKETFGALYNWYTVSTGKLCPSGWHVPQIGDWETLITFLGGTEVAGGKMKEAGSVHWERPNLGATNESGFTALPGGHRWGYMGQSFGSGLCRTNGFWWSQHSADIYGQTRFLMHDYTGVGDWGFDKCYGQSVRCIKD